MTNIVLNSGLEGELLEVDAVYVGSIGALMYIALCVLRLIRVMEVGKGKAIG